MEKNERRDTVITVLIVIIIIVLLGLISGMFDPLIRWMARILITNK